MLCPTFQQFKINPEHFIAEAIRLINEQKATTIIGHLRYNILNETHDIDIFTEAQSKQDFSKAGKVDQIKNNRELNEIIWSLCKK